MRLMGNDVQVHVLVDVEPQSFAPWWKGIE